MVLGRRELSAIIVAVAAIVFYLVLLSTTPSGAQTGGTTGDENCPGAELVETFTGTGDRQTPRFEIEGTSFLVTSDVNATGDPDLLFFSIRVRDQNGNTVSTITQEQPGTESSFVNEGPGRFFLDIRAANAEYTITVEDCVGTDDTDQNGGNQTIQEDDIFEDDVFDITEDLRDRRREDRNANQPQKARRPPVINIPKKPLPPSGGLPVYGVVAGFVLTGAGLLALGVVIRRGSRRR